MAFDQFIDDIAAYLAIVQPKGSNGPKAFRLPISHFSEAEPWTPAAVEALKERVPGFKDKLIPMDVSVLDVDHFDTTQIIQAGAVGGLFALDRTRTVAPQQVRGRVARVYPHMLELGNAVVWKDGRYTTQLAYFGSYDAKDWTVIGPQGSVVDLMHPIDPQERTNLALALGTFFLRDYDWRIVLGYAGHTSLSFGTDATGAAEVFRLRDIPDGKSRRDALLHWVKTHWRIKHDDPSALVRVREHLRGQTKFNSNGLSCRVIPSTFDQRRAQRARVV